MGLNIAKQFNNCTEDISGYNIFKWKKPIILWKYDNINYIEFYLVAKW